MALRAAYGEVSEAVSGDRRYVVTGEHGRYYVKVYRAPHGYLNYLNVDLKVVPGQWSPSDQYYWPTQEAAEAAVASVCGPAEDW